MSTGIPLDRPLVLDGGLASDLAAAGHDLSDHLWSARLLADAPDAIVETHLRFLRAGAQVITTASSQATVAGFTRRGIPE
ncbi:MAG TPA: homocysteine S-methyltransferase family protein, partial [Micromonosporaceae bacterium]